MLSSMPLVILQGTEMVMSTDGFQRVPISRRFLYNHAPGRRTLTLPLVPLRARAAGPP
jgi:hypothetical protein